VLGIKITGAELFEIACRNKKRVTKYRLYKKTFACFILPLKTLVLQHI
jgi:hypothetical protein